VLKDLSIGVGKEEDDFKLKKPQCVINKEYDYRKRRLNKMISPNINDAFTMGDKILDASVRDLC